MAQFTRLAAAIAAASLAGAVHAAPTIEWGGDVEFLYEYTDADSSTTGSESKIALDTAELSMTYSEGNVTAGITLDAASDVELENAFLNYKINDNYTLFAENDDTQIGFQLNSAIWSDVLADDLADFRATAAGVIISGGPISSTIYLMTPDEEESVNGDYDLKEFGTQVTYSHDMFNAHFGYMSVTAVSADQGAFSLGADATINDITLIAEYNWLDDSINGDDPTFLHLEANYEMKGYLFAAAYDTTDEASAIGDAVEDQIALAVTKDITDLLWVQGELAFQEGYTDNSDTTILTVIVGATF